MARLNDTKVVAKCSCGYTTVGDAYPIVCEECQRVIHRDTEVLASMLAGVSTVRIDAPSDPRADPVNHPAHYTTHPSKVECIQITEHMGFCLGNAIKYIWRADLKADAIEDLKKARWYLDREIAKREAKP